MRKRFSVIFVSWIAIVTCLGFTNSFTPIVGSSRSVSKPCFQLGSSSTNIPTLTEATTWKMRLKFNALPIQSENQYENVDRIFSLRAKFLEDEGYEPPQGTLEQVTSDDEFQLKISKGRWTLSEDPDDRKDGLWVWGLFQEPLYPFLLLNLETEAHDFQLGNEQISVPAMKLFAKIPHRRKEGSVVLDTAVLNVRSTEKLQLVGAVADYFDDKCVGQLQINPFM